MIAHDSNTNGTDMFCSESLFGPAVAPECLTPTLTRDADVASSVNQHIRS